MRSHAVGFQIWLERGRNFDAAIGLLVGFHQGDEQAGQRGAAAVEDVGELVFARFGLASRLLSKERDGFPGRTRRSDLLTKILTYPLLSSQPLSQSTPVPYVRFSGSTFEGSERKNRLLVVLLYPARWAGVAC